MAARNEASRLFFSLTWNVKVKSGTPERCDWHWIDPLMSEEMTEPEEDRMQSISSTRST